MIPLPRRSFLRHLGLATAALQMNLAAPPAWGATKPRHALPRGIPGELGFDPEGALAFLDALAGSRHELHSIMVVRHGHVVAEGWWAPYHPAVPQMMYSLSKSFTSTGIGLAVAEKRLTVDDPVISFFPEELPATVSENLRRLRVKDLLTMSVGHAQDSMGALWGETHWVRKFLSLPIPNTPGTQFLYNSGATYVLSAIIQKLTGRKLVDYLESRLFQPLGIENVTWEVCPSGINTGGWGLRITTEGLAKFGQLYLQQGAWKGQQLLSRSWIAEATSAHIQQPAPDLEKAKANSEWHQGYGYQFWRCRHQAYRGDGAFGQYTIVLPEQDAVIAITGETSDMQGVLNLVWEHLLPSSASKLLTSRLASASLPPLVGIASPKDLCRRVTGKTFVLEGSKPAAESVRFDFLPRECVFSVTANSQVHTIRCGVGKWIEGVTDLPGTPPRLTAGELGPMKIAASAHWEDPTTMQMSWRFFETPHHDTVTCRFGDGTITIEFLDSLAAMSPAKKDKRPSWHGRLHV
jgi:CubicO group peptidase (beta-lactamase class C family)